MSASRVWAVFSTFRPGESAREAVASVAAQVDGVIVVDDGSGAEADATLSALASNGITVVRRPANDGIAAALNDGIVRAREAGAEFVLTFDQDSRIAQGFVAALLAAHDAAAAEGERVGVIVPEFFAGVRQQRGAEAVFGDAANVIQSGMLIPAPVIEAVGALREDFFIDLVDTEFELRLRRRGWRVLAAGGVRMEHALGTKYRRELFGRTLRLPGIPPEITLSTPFRYFYRLRNRIVLNNEYFRSAPRQIARDTLLDVIHFVNALWVARPRRALLRVYRAAVVAALRGRMGRMPQALAPVAGEIRWTAPVVEAESV
ncbi:glycosyltransferase [Zhihengliuella sp. ISTPL4]|uniref:glycosyltransferase n=1 Tax=Zhihengliuella sp. ISTPL4 TaxID=2058657 RepID=UPI000C7BFA0D|nr:glycosyltransferase [Zhihengliuella sp. ISTPL4]